MISTIDTPSVLLGIPTIYVYTVGPRTPAMLKQAGADIPRLPHTCVDLRHVCQHLHEHAKQRDEYLSMEELYGA